MINIRSATINDAEELLNIYAPYVENTAISFEYTAPSVADFRERIAKTLTEYPYLVASTDDGIVGYAYAGPFHSRAAFKYSAEVSIYVDRNYRGQGLGKQLYTEIEQILSEQNVFTACAVSNSAAGIM